LLDQIDGSVASFTGDGAYDQDGVYATVTERHPDAAVIVPPRSSAVPSETAETAPTQRDRHLQLIATRGRVAWQKASGYNWRALVEAAIGRWKRVIGEALRSRTTRRRMTEVVIATNVLNRLPELGRRPMSVSYETRKVWYHCVHRHDRCTKVSARRSRVDSVVPLSRLPLPHLARRLPRFADLTAHPVVSGAKDVALGAVSPSFGSLQKRVIPLRYSPLRPRGPRSVAGPHRGPLRRSRSQGTADDCGPLHLD
jgi:hypothetical protein